MAHQDLPKARDMIELPGPFTFKVFVRPEKVGAEQLQKVAKAELDRPVRYDSKGTNKSRNGKYTAHTLEIHIETYEEIEALYVAFKSLDGVVMTL